jgi:hypothetical protein
LKLKVKNRAALGRKPKVKGEGRFNSTIPLSGNSGNHAVQLKSHVPEHALSGPALGGNIKTEKGSGHYGSQNP